MVCRGHIDRIFGISQATYVVRLVRRWQMSVVSRGRCPGVMIDTCFGIYVQTRKHIVGPPVDNVTSAGYSISDRNMRHPFWGFETNPLVSRDVF
ncbi:hypothetical protein ACTXT7_010691 [Hymenolepis weldensis]